MDEKLKYPIGKQFITEAYNPNVISEQTGLIAALPEKLRDLVSSMRDIEDEGGNTYREGGWTVRQIVHHLADSHMNAFMRFKLALTEETPVIKPFSEALWAELPDAQEQDIHDSMQIITGIHRRWEGLLKSMDEDQFRRFLHHPDAGKNFTLWEMLAMYSWHGEHHLAHIRLALGEKR